MASVQKQFEAFDDAIRLGRFEENQTLRDKRDIIRKKLESRLPDIFEVHREVCPKFFFLDQGSYDMGTGIKPLDGDYDIDQGLYFVACYADYPDPVLLKKRVYEALEGHTQDVCIRQPCVTVFYQEAGESIYHVDIAVYSDGSSNNDGKVRLARGKEYSAQENRRWEISDPQELSETIFAKFTNESDRDQFRRIVRYLKQWKNVNFSMDGRAAPIGIGLTVAAYDNLQPLYTPFDYTDNDLEALRRLVRAMLNSIRAYMGSYREEVSSSPFCSASCRTQERSLSPNDQPANGNV